MGTGQKAFPGRTPATIYLAQMEKQYAPIPQLRADLPPPLIHLIERMLEPEPAKRIGSYDEILQTLGALAGTVAPNAAVAAPVARSMVTCALGSAAWIALVTARTQ